MRTGRSLEVMLQGATIFQARMRFGRCSLALVVVALMLVGGLSLNVLRSSRVLENSPKTLREGVS